MAGSDKKGYKAEVIGIFGSYVRGEQKEGSDIDVLARSHKGTTLFELAGLSMFLKKSLVLKLTQLPMM
ncbi:hypothetical protein B6U74_05100 [Candidatus Bathyarchaeota archaeon ex4484_205]|nr:MAG: hypothetical protein B6U74_05100 [Candidatus Bathyarchaeota archaeon ex4484_205]